MGGAAVDSEEERWGTIGPSSVRAGSAANDPLADTLGIQEYGGASVDGHSSAPQAIQDIQHLLNQLNLEDEE